MSWFLIVFASAALLQAPLSPRTPLLPGLRQRLVILDPGHGGLDSGAVGHGTKEITVNLAVARMTAVELQQAGVHVHLTHGADIGPFTGGMGLTNDQRLNMRRRAREANALRPDLFISIHMNHASSAARGSQVFIDRHTDAGSRRAATYLSRRLSLVSQSHRQVSRSLNHYLLRELRVPRVTLELGYLSNDAEARKLASPSYQRQLAHAVAVSVLQYLTDPPDGGSQARTSYGTMRVGS